MAETLELKDGRFRYWFSSDVITRGGPRYPLVGTHISTGDELVLSGGKVFKRRQINGKRVLFWPHAVGDWDHEQIIPGHMLLPVETPPFGSKSRRPLVIVDKLNELFLVHSIEA